ncbi:hypothetical protein FRC06_007250 [Ceratobasidium sp. 370]|nr:hypothetical protein FRC06_007250 [Ceratobasidium sp. 370]
MSSMSTGDVQSLLAEYKAFLALPLKDKNFDTFRHVITRILAAGRNTSTSQSYRNSPLANVDPRHNLSWLPQTKTDSMPPRKGKGKGKGQQDPSHDLNTTAVNTTANPPPSQSSAQHEYYPGYSDEHPPSSQHATADDTVPFYDNSAHRPVLPPIESFYESPATPAPQHSATPSAQAYNPAASSNYHMPAVLTPSREAPSPRSIPPMPSISYVRTSSIASSAGYSQPGQPQLSGSVTSQGSSDNRVLTPGNSNTGHTASWQLQPTGGTPCNVEPSQRPVSVMGPPRLPPPTPTASISSNQLASRPPPTSQPPPQAATMPVQTPATSASAPSNAQSSGPNPNSDTPGSKPPPNPTSTSKVTRTGGPAYVTDAERAREHKNWRLHEDGFLLRYFLSPTDPRAPQRLQQALAPQTYNGPRPPNRRVFLDLAAHPHFFNNTRSPQLIYEHFLKMRETLADIQRFRQHYPIEWAGEPDEEALLQRIQRQLNELKTQHGVRVGITAWRLHQYVVQSWYHWLRTSALNNLPAVQTTTRFYSGNISPPTSAASAPSALPSQASINAPLPSSAQAHAPTPSHPPVEAAMPPPAPPTPQQPTDLPRNNPGTLPSLEDTTGTSTPPRTPSVSSLRISRDASSGRLARRNISSSLYSRSGGGSGTPTHSEVSSVSGLSRATNLPAVVSEPTSAELVRQGQRQLELQEREVEENARVADLTRTLMQATFDFSHQESAQRLEIDHQRLELDRQRVQLEEQHMQARIQHEEQRLQLEEQRLQLEHHRLQLEGHNQVFEVERLALASVAAQMSLGVVPGRMPGITLGSQARPPQAGGHQSLMPAVPNFNEWLDQARAYYAHSMGYPGLAPTSTAAPHHSTPTTAQQRMSGAGAGSSNHARRLRGFTPPASQAQIEDMGTVRGTPRAGAAGDDLEDVVGMELEHEDEDEGGNGNGNGVSYGEQS